VYRKQVILKRTNGTSLQMPPDGGLRDFKLRVPNTSNKSGKKDFCQIYRWFLAFTSLLHVYKIPSHSVPERINPVQYSHTINLLCNLMLSSLYLGLFPWDFPTSMLYFYVFFTVLFCFGT
jgi:hypothetical protein